MHTYILLSLLTIYNLSDIENISEEWIAPGAGISKETLVEFADYREMFQSDVVPYMGFHVTFLEVDDVELWRAVVVYSDRVVLFQENQDPIVTYYDFPVDCLSYSDNGNYVALFEKTAQEQSSGRNGLRVNTETGECRYFDSQPNGLGPFFSIVWDDGAITFSRDVAYNYSRLYFMDSGLSIANTLDIHNLRIPGISEDLLIAPTSEGLECFNRFGNEIWVSSQNAASYTIPALSISADARYLLMPFSVGGNSGLWLRAVDTGDIVFEYSFSSPCTVLDLPIFQHDNSSWLCSASRYNAEGEIQHLVLSGDVKSSTTSYRPYPVPDSNYRLIGVSGSTLLIRHIAGQSAEQSRYILTDQEFNPLFATEKGSMQEIVTDVMGEPTVQGIALSNSYSKLIYSDNNGIHLLELGE